MWRRGSSPRRPSAGGDSGEVSLGTNSGRYKRRDSVFVGSLPAEGERCSEVLRMA